MPRTNDKLKVIRYILNELESKDEPMSGGVEAYLVSALDNLNTKQLSILLYHIQKLSGSHKASCS